MRFLKENCLVEGIADARKYYPTIKDSDFNRIIRLDPTTNIEKDKLGTYSKWLLNLFKNNKLDNEGHVKDLLARFDKEKKRLKNKDIMSYKSLEDVDKALDDDSSYNQLSSRQELRQTQKAVRNTDIDKDAKLVYEDSDWEVWVPLTYEASCKLGQGSRWCTASTSNDYYYNYYKDNYGGNYYININKHNPSEKYQFHFESRQFMNKDDESIDLEAFMINNPKLKEFYTPICKKVIEEMDGGIPEKYSFTITTEKFADTVSTRDISSEFIQACLAGDTWNYFEGYDEYATDENGSYALEQYLDEDSKEYLKSHNLSIEDDIVISSSARAYADAEESGAIEDCQKDFDNAFQTAMDHVEDKYSNLTWTREESNPNIPIKGYGDIYIEINNVNTDIFKLIQQGNDEDDIYDDVLYTIQDNWKFDEPYYGWQGFDSAVYNENLINYLSDEV